MITLRKINAAYNNNQYNTIHKYNYYNRYLYKHDSKYSWQHTTHYMGINGKWKYHAI